MAYSPMVIGAHTPIEIASGQYPYTQLDLRAASGVCHPTRSRRRL
jgi:hypothetical protein